MTRRWRVRPRASDARRREVAARRADGRGANKSLFRCNLSVHFFVTGQRNEPKKARLGGLPLSTPAMARAIDGGYACSPTAKPATHRLSAREGEVIEAFAFAASK